MVCLGQKRYRDSHPEQVKKDAAVKRQKRRILKLAKEFQQLDKSLK